MIQGHKSTQIKFNQGMALLHLANLYPSLQDVIMELVQNALDKDVNATRIWISVNYKNRYVAVRDNGTGTSISRFNEALGSVATPGRKGLGSLGQFGIGLISPLGKCDRFTFTSCSVPNIAPYHEWEFDTKHITGQKGDLFIPNRDRYDLSFEEKSQRAKTCEWRSEVAMHNITTDSFKGRVSLEGIVGGIRDRYNAVMLRNKVRLFIRITDTNGKEEKLDNVGALEFRGRKLEEQELTGSSGGGILFKMFIAPKSKTGRKGKVLMGVMGNDFRFPFHYLSSSVGPLLGEAVFSALSSGLFEGEIISEKAKLHANRNAFEKDDFFIELCIAIEDWFEGFGKQHMEEARQSRQEERFQELGLRSMKVLEALLENPAHAPLLQVIKSFRRGSMGTGHANVPENKILGQQEEKTLSASNGNPGITRTESEEERPHQSKPENHKPDHMPLTVGGPKGQQRKVVRGHSMGLGFSYEGMETSADLWKLDTMSGILHFNIRHPLWISCDVKSDASLMKLQEFVVMQALTLHVMPEPLRDSQRKYADELAHSMVSWILVGDKARGTLPNNKGRKKQKEDK